MSIANTHRFFVPTDTLRGDQVLIEDAGLAHQMSGVLRLRAGVHILLLDDSGAEYVVALDEVGRKRVTGRVVEQRAGKGEPRTHLTLFMALLRGERFEWVLQKGTELGVSAFVPVQFARSQGSDRADERKLERWRRIIREAAEQSCRARLPTLVAPIPFAAACTEVKDDVSLILYEGEATPLRDVVNNFAIFQGQEKATLARPERLVLVSGPEGGIAPEEITTASEHGMMPVSLGSRILRAETAPIAAAAALLFALGDL